MVIHCQESALARKLRMLLDNLSLVPLKVRESSHTDKGFFQEISHMNLLSISGEARTINDIQEILWRSLQWSEFLWPAQETPNFENFKPVETWAAKNRLLNLQHSTVKKLADIITHLETCYLAWKWKYYSKGKAENHSGFIPSFGNQMKFFSWLDFKIAH